MQHALAALNDLRNGPIPERKLATPELQWMETAMRDIETESEKYEALKKYKEELEEVLSKMTEANRVLLNPNPKLTHSSAELTKQHEEITAEIECYREKFRQVVGKSVELRIEREKTMQYHDRAQQQNAKLREQTMLRHFDPTPEEVRVTSLLRDTQHKIDFLLHLGKVLIPPSLPAGLPEVKRRHQSPYTGWQATTTDRMVTAPGSGTFSNSDKLFDQANIYSSCIKTAQKLRAIPMDIALNSAMKTSSHLHSTKESQFSRPISGRGRRSIAYKRTACFRSSIKVSEEQQRKIALAHSHGWRKHGGTKELREFLRHRYGGLLNAWQHIGGINEKVSFIQFCDTFRQWGFVGDVRLLFQDLLSAYDGPGDDGSSNISCRNLDPAGYAAYTDFLTKLDSYGSLAAGWAEVFMNKERLDRATFEKHCNDAGIRHPTKVYRWVENRGVVLPETLGIKRIESCSDLDATKTRLSTVSVTTQKKRESKGDDGEVLIARLKAALIQRYGSLLRAWRRGFDPYNHGSVPYSIFFSVAQDVGFTAVKDVWQAFRPTSELLTQQQFDAASYERFSVFDKLIRDTFGDYVFAWVAAFDMDGNNRLDFNEFEMRLNFLGYPYSIKHLFQSLQPHKSIKFLSIEDLDLKAASDFWRSGAPPAALELKAKLGKQWHEHENSKRTFSVFQRQRPRHDTVQMTEHTLSTNLPAASDSSKFAEQPAKDAELPDDIAEDMDTSAANAEISLALAEATN
eukprot:GEMP01020282.1.p1 GENE.GEMP01020282.1~~GEMP01020282.1.p1  ORF type:complete len:741 (+),score=160.69 GEMP01020282.1:62-2284(+)